MLGATRTATPTVFIVDDDISVRESLESLIAEAGWRPEVFASAQEFLARPRSPQPGCLVLDLSLPDLNGLELQERISDRSNLPIIFITGHGDIPSTVRAMKAGAVEFLTKPFGPEVLLTAIRGALERSRASLDDAADLLTLRGRYQSLTGREQQVMAHVVLGQMNKQVGGELGISEVTVKAHRGRMMRKMKAKSVAELVHMAARLGHATAGERARDSVAL
jgi:FixJ family two-component response regulator